MVIIPALGFGLINAGKIPALLNFFSSSFFRELVCVLIDGFEVDAVGDDGGCDRVPAWVSGAWKG